MGRLAKNWFLVGLGVVIPVGLVLGTNGWRPVEGLAPRVATAAVLFLMAFSLDSRHLRDSLLAPFPVLWASLVNYGLIPLLAWPVASVQLSEGLAVGLVAAAAAPCTMAAASVWTRRAGGNDAISLMVTLLTNTVCFAVAPFWMWLAAGSEIELSLGEFVLRLLVVVLVPTILGQAVRAIPVAAAFATRRKRFVSDLAQATILVLVLNGAVNAGFGIASERGGGSPGVAAVAVVLVSCVGIHLLAMLVSGLGSRAFGFRRADLLATLFAGSQKTLPVGLLLATEADVPFALFPILIYHASQLFLDTFVADWARQPETDAASADDETGQPGEPG